MRQGAPGGLGDRRVKFTPIDVVAGHDVAVSPTGLCERSCDEGGDVAHVDDMLSATRKSRNRPSSIQRTCSL